MDREKEARTVPEEPAAVVRDGNLKASIWRNDGEKGAFYATTFARTYKDQDGEYRDTNSFVAADLLKLSELAREAYKRTNALRRADRAEERKRGEGPEVARRGAFKEKRESGRSSDRSTEHSR